MVSTATTSSDLHRRAISLTEMLVVIGIVAVLLALLLPALARVRRASLRAGCASNLRQISALLNLYGNQNRGELPAAYSSVVGDPTARPVTASGYLADGRGGVKLLVSRPIGLAGSDYAPNAKIFLCPADTLFAPNRPTDDDFGYDVLRWGPPQPGTDSRAISYLYLYVPADGSGRNIPATPPIPGPNRGYERHTLAQSHAASLAIFTDAAPMNSAPFHGLDRNMLYLDGHVASIVARDAGSYAGAPSIAALHAFYDDLDAGGSPH